jgi:Integrase core domain
MSRVTQDDVLFGYRLQLFDLAGRIGVSAACRTFGVHRSTYYAWKRHPHLQARPPRRQRAPGRRLAARARPRRQRQRVPNERFRQTIEQLGGRITYIQAGRPQTNGHVEALHKTILDECWRPAFARYLFPRYSGLRRELDRYLTYYNHDRVHHGRLNNGRVPANIVPTVPARWRRDEPNLSAHLGGGPA